MQHIWVLYATVVAFLWSALSTLFAYPHMIAYFNEVAGGPMGGAQYLLDSGNAWGQDVLLLKAWYERHPEARPLGVAAFGWVDPRIAGIEYYIPPIGPARASVVGADAQRSLGPLPGWYAVDVNYVHGSEWPMHDGKGGMYWPRPDGVNFEYFARFRPVAMAGYSFQIVHVSLEEANRVRKELGLSQLEEQSLKAVKGEMGE
jgi:hypothetical protein